MHVYIAGHNLARRHRSLAHLRGDLRNMSSGKGATDAQARASGLCEGLERYSGVYPGRRAAPASDRPPTWATPPSRSTTACSSASGSIASATPGTRGSRTINFVPVPFDPDAEIDWTPVWSLTRRRAALPADGLLLLQRTPARRRAVLHRRLQRQRGRQHAGGGHPPGLPRAGRARRRRPLVVQPRPAPGGRPRQLRRPYLERLASVPARSRARDLGARPDDRPGHPGLRRHRRARSGAREERIMLGFGAHLDPRVALLRAVTEMNQMLVQPAREPAQRRGRATVDDPETLDWLRTATVANQPYLLPDRRGRPRGRWLVSDGRGPTTWPRTSGLPGPGRAAGHGDDGPGPDAAGDRPAGRQGDRAGPAALLGAVRARPAVRRAGPAGLAAASRRRRRS